MEVEFLKSLIIPAQTKIAMIIMDGLGGLPLEPGGKTELETACTPHLDALAEHSALGLTIPVGPGITPGSGPGHLAIFGYDPIQYEIGRGVLEALGVDFDLGPDDVAARGNFCSIDQEGLITDRRAGRLPTEESQELASLLQTIRIDGVDFFIKVVREHRFAFVMRAPGLGDCFDGNGPAEDWCSCPAGFCAASRFRKICPACQPICPTSATIVSGQTSCQHDPSARFCQVS